MSIKNLIQDIEIKKLKEEYNNNKELLNTHFKNGTEQR